MILVCHHHFYYHNVCPFQVLGYFFDTYEGYVADKERTPSDGGGKTKGKYKKGRFLVKVSENLQMDILSALTEQNMTFSQRDASVLFKNMIIALDEIHCLGVLHRDIKPENIMFTNDARDLTNPNRFCLLYIHIIHYILVCVCV